MVTLIYIIMGICTFYVCLFLVVKRFEFPKALCKCLFFYYYYYYCYYNYTACICLLPITVCCGPFVRYFYMYTACISLFICAGTYV